MNLTLGCEEVESVRAALEPLEGLTSLEKFVMAYANVNPDGGRLTERTVILEGVLYSVWLQACAELNVRPGNPTMPVISTAEDDDAD